MNYKLIIQYDGTRYDGWQRQGNTENTIQGRIEEVLSRMVQAPVEVQGAGRTDAGPVCIWIRMLRRMKSADI